MSKNTINMSLENRYTEAMRLAGYNLESFFLDDEIIFKHYINGDTLMYNDWIEVGKALEDMSSVYYAEKERFDELIHPKERISFYTKNLSGTGLLEDTEGTFYSDVTDALNDYFEAGAVDGKEIGYIFDGKERKLSSFDTFHMKHRFADINRSELFAGLTVNEKNDILHIINFIKPHLRKDNRYYTIEQAIGLVGYRSVSSMIKNKMEWGSWLGRVVNTSFPQDYIDIDITGYERSHEVVYSLDIVKENAIVDRKQYVAKIDPVNFEESIRKGLESAQKEFEPFVRSNVNVFLDSDPSPLLRLYSPYTENTLEMHMESLKKAGYEPVPNRKSIFDMNLEDLKAYIQSFYQKQNNIICTKYMLNFLGDLVRKMVEVKELYPSYDVLNEFLRKDNIIQYVKSKQPNLEPVPDDVVESIKNYFKQSSLNIQPLEVCRISNHPEASYLYAVIGKHSDDTYACWTSWNQTLESLNFGHYNLPTKEDAYWCIRDTFNNITGDKKQYGPENTRRTINDDSASLLQEEIIKRDEPLHSFTVKRKTR